VKLRTTCAFILAATVLAGCPKKDNEEEPTNDARLTLAEARQALEESAVASEASNLPSGTVEITTGFTIGTAVESAAAEIAEFIVSQIPCAEVSVSGATVSVEYGVNAGDCTYNGQAYTGMHTVTVSRTDEADILVHHEWDEISNDNVSVSGEADVTWSVSDRTRHVVHSLTWTRLSDGRSGTGSGDRLQSGLDGDITQGFEVDGSRKWEGEAGTWDLDIDGVQWRWVDAVPESGSYSLTTPKNKEITLSFERVDGDTIKVTLAGPRASFNLNVTQRGQVSDGES